jgi:hypothetical protein
MDADRAEVSVAKSKHLILRHLRDIFKVACAARTILPSPPFVRTAHATEEQTSEGGGRVHSHRGLKPPATINRPYGTKRAEQLRQIIQLSHVIVQDEVLLLFGQMRGVFCQ